MNSQRRNKRRVPKATRRRRRAPRNRGGIRNPSRIPNVIADVHFAYMKYTSQVIGLTGTSNHASQLYYLNSVYRPEGSGSDTSNAIGFTELVTLYETWQVYSANVTLTIVNEEAFEVIVTTAPSLASLSLTSALLVTQLGELPYGRTTVISRNTGQNRAVLRTRINLAKFVGNRNFYHGSTSWMGGQTIRPTNLIPFYFAVASLSGDNLTNGVTFTLTIDFKIKWSGRIFNDILGLTSRSQSMEIDDEVPVPAKNRHSSGKSVLRTRSAK